MHLLSLTSLLKLTNGKDDVNNSRYIFHTNAHCGFGNRYYRWCTFALRQREPRPSFDPQNWDSMTAVTTCSVFWWGRRTRSGFNKSIAPTFTDGDCFSTRPSINSFAEFLIVGIENTCNQQSFPHQCYLLSLALIISQFLQILLAWKKVFVTQWS